MKKSFVILTFFALMLGLALVSPFGGVDSAHAVDVNVERPGVGGDIPSADSLIGGEEDLETAATNLAETITNILVVVAVALIVIVLIWGAILYMTAGGSEDQAGKAKSVIINGIIGALIIVLLGFIIGFLFDQVPNFLGGDSVV